MRDFVRDTIMILSALVAGILAGWIAHAEYAASMAPPPAEWIEGRTTYVVCPDGYPVVLSC